jgi:uracil-DNA glycosylase family protein
VAARQRFPGADEFVPGRRSLDALRRAAADCRGCDLYENATQTVFGSGPGSARLMLVGEQPGDVEDRRGEPFVGPAGKLLDRALQQAGLAHSDMFLTNAVKHFRWKPAPRGERRIHQKPDVAHISACHPWLAAELTTIGPDGIVALGATAAQALLGSAFRLTAHRGEILDWPPATGPFAESDTLVQFVVATVHPSAVLRAHGEDRDVMFAGLVDDLRLASLAA